MSFIVTPGQLNRRAELYHQLGTLVRAGIPLVKALEMASVRSAVPGGRRVLHSLVQDLNAGCSFSESLMRAGAWLPEFDVALLATGEKTGRLDVTFQLLGEYYAARAKIIRDTIAGMLITAATLHVFLLVFPLSYLVSFAQGLMNGQYSECIPFIIEKLVAYGALYGFVFFLIFACQGSRGEDWRAAVESIANMIPILRTARKYLVLARLSAALEALISAGVSILTAWELGSSASGSVYIKRTVAEWKHRLENGETPAELVNETSYFPEMFANYYLTGEQSGQLDDSLRRARDFYQEEGFRVLRMFTRIMNGCLYGAVALMVAFNIIRFWMNYYSNLMSGF